jgi:hypothetical protein
MHNLRPIPYYKMPTTLRNVIFSALSVCFITAIDRCTLRSSKVIKGPNKRIKVAISGVKGTNKLVKGPHNAG